MLLHLFYHGGDSTNKAVPFMMCVTFHTAAGGPCNSPDWCNAGDRRGEETDCALYWWCVNGKWQITSCPARSEFDINRKVCVKPGQAVCEGPCPTTVPYTGTMVTVPPGKHSSN